MTPTTCPACQSANILFSKKRILWLCEDCEHDWTPVEERTPLRIFLSYGRDEFAAVAERMRDDLVARGHEIWFDKNKLKEGSDWETYIEEGLKWAAKEPATGRIVFVMTPHSVRRPDGYCLNEIALALSKSVPIVPVMLVWSEPPLSIYRLQFLDMRDTYRHEEKQLVGGVYERKLERLVEALEQRKTDFEGSQSRLIRVLEPINFSADIFKHQKDFTGRQWVFAQVDAWLADREGSKLFWITGAPGAGKSALAAWIRDNRSQVAAFHFCDASSDEKHNPSKLVSSIACQLATQLPEYQERLVGLDLETIKQEYSAPSRAYTLFDKLVVQPLSENFPEPDRTLVVLIDALDEATSQGRNEIVRFLAQSADKAPKWLRFMVTSRPEQEILVPLQSYRPFFLDASGQNNQNDLIAYLRAKVPAITAPQVQAILERSEGLFLYVKQVCEDLVRGNLSIDKLDEFPRGLGGIYEQFFTRQFGTSPEFYQTEIIPLLYLVLAAYEPLTLQFLKKERGWINNNELFLCIDRLGSLFPRTGDGDNGTLKPFHKSVTDWLSAKASSGSFYVDAAWGHRLLSQAGWKQFLAGPETMDGYFLFWLPRHLTATGEENRLVELLKDFRFLMARTQAGALGQELLDFRSLNPKVASELRYEQAFFRERAHLLRRGNDAWPAYKILLQLAIEHADNSPMTIAAAKWLAEGRCDWEWIRRIQRVDEVGIDPCIAVMEGHTGIVQGAAELGNGNLLTWSRDGTIRIWNREGDLLRVLVGHTDRVEHVLERRDGSYVSCSSDNTLRLWTSQGEPAKVMEGHSNMVSGVLERDDRTLVSWACDCSIRLWSAEGEPLRALGGHTDAVQEVLQCTSGTLISWTGELAAEDFTIRFWTFQGDLINVCVAHTDCVLGAMERKDGLIVSWSGDGTLKLWTQQGDLLKTLEGHSKAVIGVMERIDGSVLSWSRDNSLRLWTSRGDLIQVLGGHTAPVLWVRERNGVLVSWSEDNTLRIWDSEGETLQVLGLDGLKKMADGTFLSWSGDHSLRVQSRSRGFVCSNGDLVSWDEEIIRLWDYKVDTQKTVEGHRDWVGGFLTREDGGLISWSDDHTMKVWKPVGVLVRTIEGHSHFVRGLVEITGGKLLSWSFDGTLRIWSPEGASIQVLKGHTDWVLGVLLRKNGTILSWSNDHTIRIWSLKGDIIRVLEGHQAGINGVLECGDGTLISWSSDGTLRLWNANGDLQKTLFAHTRSVDGCIERVDGSLISWGEWDPKIKLWSSSGEPLKVLLGHSRGIEGIQEFSDCTFASWSRDETIRLWSSEGDLQRVLNGHNGTIEGVRRYAGSGYVSWTRDQTIRLWSQVGASLGVWSDTDLEHEFFETEIHSKRGHGPTFWGHFGNALSIAHFENDRPTAHICWQPRTRSYPQCLFPDGRMVATQDDGQVCFLQLYHGNQPIPLPTNERAQL